MRIKQQVMSLSVAVGLVGRIRRCGGGGGGLGHAALCMPHAAPGAIPPRLTATTAAGAGEAQHAVLDASLAIWRILGSIQQATQAADGFPAGEAPPPVRRRLPCMPLLRSGCWLGHPRLPGVGCKCCIPGPPFGLWVGGGSPAADRLVPRTARRPGQPRARPPARAAGLPHLHPGSHAARLGCGTPAAAGGAQPWPPGRRAGGAAARRRPGAAGSAGRPNVPGD